VVTDGEGRYRFQGVRRGSHELVVALANGYLPSEPVKLQIAGSERRAEANIALRRAAVGWFRVLGEDDRPVANVMVAMSDDAAGGSSMDAQPTDMEGVVSLPARFATQTRWASAVGTDGFGFVLLPTPLRGADDPIVIRLTRATAALHLNIRDEKGKAVPGAGVLMRLNGHALTQSVLMLAGYVQHFEPRSNDSGELYLGRWPAGAIEVWAYHDAAEKYDIMAGPRPKPATATIVPGENRLDVLLHSR